MQAGDTPFSTFPQASVLGSKCCCSIIEISKLLGFHKTTVYREIKRNSSKEQYEAEKAMIKAADRFKKCRRLKKINLQLSEVLRVYLNFGWSPEQISGRLKQEKNISISYQTIYRSISRRSLTAKLLRKNGRRGTGRYTQKKAMLKNKVMIEKRPSIVEQRKRIGDWERDGMYGANRKQLLVFVDRKSRLVKLKQMGTGKSKVVSSLTENTLAALGKKVFTVTNDNGSEFSDSASLPYRVYHCTPYKPQQRGTVENTIGLLR